MKKHLSHIALPLLFCLCMLSGWACAADSAVPAKPSKASYFFCNAGQRLDQFFLKGLDTAYIALPEFRWRVAFNNGEVGLNARHTTWVDPQAAVRLQANSAPSIELGLNAGFRSLSFGYSWDVSRAYATNWNLSLGSKMLGLEFQRHVTTNLSGRLYGGIEPEAPVLVGTDLQKGELKISTTNLNVWFVLNSKHYSHNAAIKQSYIQKRTAGSLLLSVAYLSSELRVLDSLKYFKDPNMAILVDGVTGMITRQVAVGLGYGINYTPNHGKVLLHAAANMQVVCFSINHVSYIVPDDIYMPGEPNFVLRPDFPVHVSGNFRAAVSWEINRWVHLSAWAQANNLSFKSSRNTGLSVLDINNWHWQTHISVGVRFGISRKRTQEVLGEQVLQPAVLPADSLTQPQGQETQNPSQKKLIKMPEWVTDYFFSTRM